MGNKGLLLMIDDRAPCLPYIHLGVHFLYYLDEKGVTHCIFENYFDKI